MRYAAHPTILCSWFHGLHVKGKVARLDFPLLLTTVTTKKGASMKVGGFLRTDLG
jgi:hypothetical protein